MRLRHFVELARVDPGDHIPCPSSHLPRSAASSPPRPPPLAEAEIARTQKNKATEYHIGQLKARLAKLRTQLLEGGGSAKGEGVGFDVSKTGDARVALIGFPSVGKSTLLTKLTGTESTAAAYEFTTLTCFAEDHELLTNRGFLSLSEVEACDDPALLFASYDTATGQLVYERATGLVVKDEGKDKVMVEMTREGGEAQWCGGEGAGAAHPTLSAGNFSLVVTPDHDMYARRGKVLLDDAGAEGEKIEWDGDGEAPADGSIPPTVEEGEEGKEEEEEQEGEEASEGRSSTSSVSGPAFPAFSKVKAESLLASSLGDAIQMLAHAPEGVAVEVSQFEPKGARKRQGGTIGSRNALAHPALTQRISRILFRAEGGPLVRRDPRPHFRRGDLFVPPARRPLARIGRRLCTLGRHRPARILLRRDASGVSPSS